VTRTYRLIVLVALCSTALTACQSRGKNADLVTQGPDEFLIVGPGPHIGRAGNEPGLPVDGCPIRQAERAMQQRAAASTVGLFELTHARLQYGGASVGVAAVEPASADAARAMRLADARMYEAKRERRAAAPAATLPVPFV